MINISDLLQASDCDSQEVTVWVGLNRWRPFLVNIHIKISLGPFSLVFSFSSSPFHCVHRAEELYCLTWWETTPLFVCRIFVRFSFKFHKDLQLFTDTSKPDLLIYNYTEVKWFILVYTGITVQSSDAVLWRWYNSACETVFLFFFFCPVLCSNDDVAWQDLGCGYEHLLV